MSFIRDAEVDGHGVQKGGIGKSRSLHPEIVSDLEYKAITAFFKREFTQARTASIGVRHPIKQFHLILPQGQRHASSRTTMHHVQNMCGKRHAACP